MFHPKLTRPSADLFLRAQIHQLVQPVATGRIVVTKNRERVLRGGGDFHFVDVIRPVQDLGGSRRPGIDSVLLCQGQHLDVFASGDARYAQWQRTKNVPAFADRIESLSATTVDAAWNPFRGVLLAATFYPPLDRLFIESKLRLVILRFPFALRFGQNEGVAVTQQRALYIVHVDGGALLDLQIASVDLFARLVHWVVDCVSVACHVLLLLRPCQASGCSIYVD